MAGTTNFLQFDQNKSNIIDDVTYSNSDYRINGCRTGLAPSAIHNKVFYQTTTFISAYARALANKGYIVNDSDFDALVAIFSGIGTSGLQRKVFTTSGTFNIPSGVTQVFLSGCGAGAGGSAVFGLGGGAGEGISMLPISVNPGESVTVTIGTGGAGGIGFNTTYTPSSFPYSTAVGTGGTNTSFGTYKVLQGGHPGTAGIMDATPGANGGQNATRGSLPYVLRMGPGEIRTDVDRHGGTGGSSLFGQGGEGGTYAPYRSLGTVYAGQAGQGYGSGGGGGAETHDSPNNVYYCNNGGAGADGILIVEWYAV